MQGMSIQLFSIFCWLACCMQTLPITSEYWKNLPNFAENVVKPLEVMVTVGTFTSAIKL